MAPKARHLIARAGLAAMHGHRFRRLDAQAKSPAAAQQKVLSEILAANADTAFGKRHRFASIRTAVDYRRAVPVQSYEDLRADIEAQELTGEARLTREQPVYYNRTSGTVAAPKNIPVTASGLKRIRGNQQLAAYSFSGWPGLFGGKMFAVTGAAVEGHMPGGTPYGSASGLLYQNQPKLLRARYVLPAELTAIEDYEDRYLSMAVFGVAESRVTVAAMPNSSTLLRLLDIVNRRAEELLRLVANGRLPVGVPDEVGASLAPQPRRAAELERRLETAGKLSYADIWSGLVGLVTWTGGSCGAAIRNLVPTLTARCAIIELGYVASEVHGTVNVDPRRNLCLPTLDHTFLEFAPRADWEANYHREFVGLADLEEGEDYYVVVTTADGLYRYDMNDIVRVNGRVHATPTLEFLQKGKGVTSITGEKLHEVQVLNAVGEALGKVNVEAEFFIVLADPATASYTLYLEPRGHLAPVPRLAPLIDEALRSGNIEYDGKRASGRLGELRMRWLKRGAGDAFREHRVAGGQRDTQFKYLHLQLAEECGFDFEPFHRPE